MAVLKIEKYPSEILKKKTKIVKTIDDEIKKIVRDMFETMYKYSGIGLAANQVGIDLSIVVIDLKDKNIAPMVLINPEIKFLDNKKKVLEEGCLSFPGYYDKVCRRNKIQVKFLDISGKEQKIVAEDLLSRVIQHEVDHLRGVLFIQRMSFLRLAKFLSQYILKNKKFE